MSGANWSGRRTLCWAWTRQAHHLHYCSSRLRGRPDTSLPRTSTRPYMTEYRGTCSCRRGSAPLHTFTGFSYTTLRNTSSCCKLFLRLKTWDYSMLITGISLAAALCTCTSPPADDARPKLLQAASLSPLRGLRGTTDLVRQT